MSIKYDELLIKAQELVAELRAETDKAANEDDMNDLETIAQTLMSGIPDRLALSDYYGRSTIRDFIDEDKQDNTNYVDSVMIKCYEKNAVYINDDFAYNNIADCIEFVKIEKGE